MQNICLEKPNLERYNKKETKMLLVKVRADDHIVLPKTLLEKLGVSAGDYLEMDEQGGKIVIRSAKGTFPVKKSGRGRCW
jgi:bifunctional DNA-binding transcriptional regulator/antitoxin component of YhaV-PrlF toxin-antitoxin module